LTGYTRKSTYVDGDTILASDSNAEFDQLLSAFDNETGHSHDGTEAEGPVIGVLGDAGVTTPLNKITVDTANDRLSFFVDVASAAVEQIRIEDGVVVPVTTADVDLGTSSVLFKDGYFSGTVEALSVETTNIKANDGTASATIADSTGVMTIASSVLTTADINAGTVDNTVIGATTPVAATVTELTANTSFVLNGSSAMTGILDEDAMGSDSATKLATQQSIKAYVDAQVTAQDLDFSADSGGALSIDLDSEAITFTGGTGIDTTGSLNDVSFAIDSTVATLTGSQTLTNKTLTTPIISTISNTGTVTLPTSTDTLVGKATTDTLTNKSIDLSTNTVTGTTAEFNTALSDGDFTTLAGSETLTNKTLTSPVLNGTLSGTAFLDEDTLSSDSAIAVASQQSIKAYVDAQVTAQDLDFSADSGGALSIDLDSEAITFTGGTGIDTTGSLNDVSFAIDSTVTTLTGTQTLTNKSITLTDNTVTGTSAELATAISDETGSGSLVFATSPTLVTPALGTPASGVLTNVTGYPGDASLVTTGALNSGSITSGFGTIDNGSSSITTTGDITGGGIHVTGDTSAGDNAALGYTSGEGLIITGQGSTNDVTIKNDADASVISIPTGTTRVVLSGSLEVGHESDTTLARTGAGVLAIEGAEITTNTATQTLTNKTLTTPTIDLSGITSSGDLGVADGGTGASTAAGARTNLDVDQAGEALAMAIALG